MLRKKNKRPKENNLGLTKIGKKIPNKTHVFLTEFKHPCGMLGSFSDVYAWYH